MKVNLGSVESFIRIFAGVALLYGALYGAIGEWGYLGVVLIATGMGRMCPLYGLLRINGIGCKTDSAH